MAKPDSNDRTAGFANCDAAAERRQAKFSDRRETASVPDASLTDSIALIADNDAELTAATAEAVERFGEFLTRFEHRRPGDTFAVKVPFTDDYGREYMWVMVTAVDGPYLIGQLDNRPAYIRSVRVGQTVRVPRRGLTDWLIVRRGIPHGGFTMRVIASRLRRANGEAA